MAISNMQQPQQIQGGLGSLQDPRQGYFLGKLVKKAKRAVKKVTKSPIGKIALLAAGANFAPMLFGKQTLMSQAGGLGGLLGKLKGGEGFLGGLGNMFRYDPSLGTGSKFSMGKMLMGGLGAAAVAAPFMMGGGDDEVEEEVDMQDPAAQVQRARNYYSGQGDGGAGLDFMPQKKYVMSNFYAADGGRAGYAGGMLVDEDDEEEEFNRSNAGMSRRLNPAFLNMGGSAGQAQAEQMLMMEYVKYKNKGGDLSFEQFVKAVMQQSAPEGAGMEQPQPVMMAANGGLMTQVPGYGKEPGTNQFDYPSGGEEVRVGYAGGQLVGPSGDGSRPGYAGKTVFGDIAEIDVGEQLKGTGQSILDLPGNVMDILSQLPESFKQLYFSLKSNSERENLLKTIMGEAKANGGRIGKQEGGIMETEVAEETMPMLDMGGMEKDFRNEGGFVAMGGKERADDVPARLSKNEFVFTADAVRNAGGGDIDAGAEVMENLMNNLEQGGQVSEESQGLEGAQAMYDQQQMLQSRIV
jgi:hypothetical protein